MNIINKKIKKLKTDLTSLIYFNSHFEKTHKIKPLNEMGIMSIF